MMVKYIQMDRSSPIGISAAVKETGERGIEHDVQIKEKPGQ
jgi:hypothetical protein